MGKYIDITGQRFGKLVAIRVEPGTKGHNTRWLCKCDCGNEYIALSNNLRKNIARQCRDCSCPISRHEGLNQAAWKEILHGAKRRNLEFTISREYAWQLFVKQGNVCALSGQPIKFADTRNGHIKLRDTTASLDRIDSSKGYIEGNVQWVHKQINLMKQSLSQEEFLNICKRIVKYNNDNCENAQ